MEKNLDITKLNKANKFASLLVLRYIEVPRYAVLFFRAANNVKALLQTKDWTTQEKRLFNDKITQNFRLETPRKQPRVIKFMRLIFKACLQLF